MCTCALRAAPGLQARAGVQVVLTQAPRCLSGYNTAGVASGDGGGGGAIGLHVHPPSPFPCLILGFCSSFSSDSPRPTDQPVSFSAHLSLPHTVDTIPSTSLAANASSERRCGERRGSKQEMHLLLMALWRERAHQPLAACLLRQLCLVRVSQAQPCCLLKHTQLRRRPHASIICLMKLAEILSS